MKKYPFKLEHCFICIGCGCLVFSLPRLICIQCGCLVYSLPFCDTTSVSSGQLQRREGDTSLAEGRHHPKI